jgi:hypothetical protein
MADIKRGDHPAMIPGYGQPPEGVRTDHPDLPDQPWGAQSEGEPTRQRDEGSEGQSVKGDPDVPMPERTPVEGP